MLTYQDIRHLKAGLFIMCFSCGFFIGTSLFLYQQMNFQNSLTAQWLRLPALFETLTIAAGQGSEGNTPLIQQRDTQRPKPPAASAEQEKPGQELNNPQQALHNWARAWSRQDIASYLSGYHSEFTPPRGDSRADWEAQRRRRLSRPTAIQVTLHEIRQLKAPSELRRIKAIQEYRSDRYADRTIKIFTLKKENGRWAILEEKTERLVTRLLPLR